MTSAEVFAAMSKLIEHDDTAPTWYETDLQLAAALGKQLLENNQELEEAVQMREATIKQLEYDILDITTRHAKSLQDVNNKHNQMLEQWDNIFAETLSDKEALELEKLESAKKIKKLQEEVEFWQQQYQAAQDKIDHLSTTERYVVPRRHSSGGLKLDHNENEEDCDRSTNNNDKLESERILLNARCDEILREASEETVRLEKTVHDLEVKCKREQRRCGILENEMTQICMEKQFLEEQLVTMKEDHQHARTIASELNEADHTKRECAKCRRNISISELQQELEGSNDSSIEVGVSKSVSLSRSDSNEEFGSQESLCSADRMSEEMNNGKHRFVKRPSLLNELLNHADFENMTCGVNTTPVRELAIQCIESVYVNNQEETTTKKVANSSFYLSLFEDRSVVSNKQRSTAAVQTDDDDDRLISCELEPLENPFRDRFHKTPEYKSLFQEIYAVLKRKVGGVVMPKKEIIPLDTL